MSNLNSWSRTGEGSYGTHSDRSDLKNATPFYPQNYQKSFVQDNGR
jgi:hypothetical protein